VRSFPHTPGVYLMKDAAGRVIYIGKAKNLRARAGSYFLKAAAEELRTARLVAEIRDIDYLDAESEVDALLLEARLIKDLLPKFNRELRDNKTFPYLEIYTHEDYPRVEITRTPKPRGAKLYGPFANSRSLRGALQVLQKIFKFRTCSLDIHEDDPRWRWYRPCLLGAMGQCAAPCNFRISREEYRKNIHRLQTFLEGNKQSLLDDLRGDMTAAAAALRFEEAARLRDELHLLETLNERGRLDTHVQPEVFPVDPKKGLAGLRKALRLAKQPRSIEGVDVAHTAGADTVASVVQFIDGLPFKPGYKRLRIRSVQRVDDVASIHEAVLRRFHHLAESEIVPDILLVDGGKGQLHAATAALASLALAAPPAGDFAGQARRVDLSRRRRRAATAQSPRLCLAAVAVRPRRGPSFRPALSPHPPPPLHLGGIRGKAEGGRKKRAGQTRKVKRPEGSLPPRPPLHPVRVSGFLL